MDVRTCIVVAAVTGLGCAHPMVPESESAAPPEVEPVEAVAPPCTLPDGLASIDDDTWLEVACAHEDRALGQLWDAATHANSEVAWVDYALAARELGAEELAEAALRKEVERTKREAIGARIGLSILRFDAYRASGHDPSIFEETLRIVRNVLALEPENDHARGMAVLLFAERGKAEPSYLELARPSCAVLLEGPVHAAACAELAYATGRPDLGAQHHDRALEMAPDDPTLRMALGRRELDAGRPDRAREHLTVAMASKRPAQRRAAALALSVALNRLGQPENARRTLDSVTPRGGEHDVAQSNPALAYQLGVLLFSSEEPSDRVRGKELLEGWLVHAPTRSTDPEDRARLLRVQALLRSKAAGTHEL